MMAPAVKSLAESSLSTPGPLSFTSGFPSEAFLQGIQSA
jgi:hypothetical protein